MFCVRLATPTAARFDAVAAGQGGRSALLRTLIVQAAGGPSAPSRPAELGAGARLMVRLGPAEARHVERQAAAMGLRRSGWVAALVRRHALRAPTLPAPAAEAALEAQRELRRIGVNLNQIARALNAAALEGRAAGLQAAEVSALRAEVRAGLAALRAALEGSGAYWDVGP